MRRYTFFLVFPLLASLLPAQSFTNGQAARAVLGQQEFTFGAGQGTGTTAYLLGGPSGVAYANGLIFVADSNIWGASANTNVVAPTNNNRVVVYNASQIPPPHANVAQYAAYSPYCSLCGYNAVNVLGQPDFISNSLQAVSASTLNAPTAVATDGQRLVVSDTNNNRVLIWNSIPTSIDQPANVVLGASSFTVPGSPTPTQSSLAGPQGVWIQNGKLFVADTVNSRVLIWNSIPTQNNQAADLVLGQSNFNSGINSLCPTAAANILCNPTSVTSDGTRLYVADFGFNRVLIWNSIPTSMDQPADVVLGQPNMTSTTYNNTAVCANGALECAASLNEPGFVLSDGTHLYVSDTGNDRVLIFNTIPTSNAASADTVLGQPDFASDVVTSSNTGNSVASTAIDNTGSVDTIPSPLGLAWDGQNLYVADPFNRRVLLFSPGDTSLPDNSVVNWASEIIRQEGVVSFALPATTGAIVANDTVTVTIQSTPYEYTIQSKDTLDTITQNVVNKINANGGDPNALAIFAGPGTATLYLSSKGSNLPYDSISLSVTTSNTADIDALASGAYLSAGTAATGAPGMLVEIDGTNLSDQPASSPAVASLTSALPKQLAGAQVFMDGWATPLLSVSANQIVTQIPYAFTNGTAPVGAASAESPTDRNSSSVYVRTVHSNGNVTVTNATPVYIAPANPGLFSAPTYSGQPRPWEAAGALHQPGNPTAVVGVAGGIAAGDTGTITVNGRNYQYTVQASDSLQSVADALISKINGVDPQVTASPGGAFPTVILTAIQPGAAGTGIPISTTTSSSAQLVLTAYTSSTCCAVTPGSAISTSNPAVPGELITLNGAGLGLLANSVTATEGVPFNGPEPNSSYTTVTVTMNGTTAQVINAGLARGAIGTYQIQCIVPSSLTANPITTVTAAQNDFISNIVTLPVGAAVTVPTAPTAPASPYAASIDAPASGTTYSGTAIFGGWALDKNTTVSSVSVYVDGVFYGTAAYGGSRPDACAVYPSSPNCPNVAWSFAFDTTQLPDGNHTFQITTTGADGTHASISKTFAVSNTASEAGTMMVIDNPSAQSTPFQGLAYFSGWALNNNAPIATVAVSIDGSTIGNATYGSLRSDVCNVYPARPGCPNVGWNILVDTSKLANGMHTVAILATATNGQHAAMQTSFQVANWSTNDPMKIHADVPNAQSGAYSGIVEFGGWAIDTLGPIVSIDVAFDGVSYGPIAYGGARPDVCAAYPGSFSCPNVGWSTGVNTTSLGDGPHTMQVTATDYSSHRTTISVPFTVANLLSSNPLKIDIDRPNSKSPAFSGSVDFGGWALSTTANMANVQILIDGVSYGPATYGNPPRPDVCAIYSSSNCPTVGWDYVLDTSILANGTHTLEVTGTSASGQRGTASAAFTVSNSTTGPVKMSIDQPNTNSSPFEGVALFYGWAIDDTSAITRVAVAVDGVPVSDATYGAARPDVCNVYPNRPGCPNVGWSLQLDTTQLADGTHTLDVTAYAANGDHLATSSSFVVGNWANLNPITISIDAPTNGGSYFGSVQFGGWAIDLDGAIANISVSIDGTPFSGASYGGSRPDVCAVYKGFAGCPNVGWGFYFDTTLIPNGNHTLAITATSQSGQSSTVSRSFTVAN